MLLLAWLKLGLPTGAAVLWTAMKAEVVCFLVATVSLWLRELMTPGGIVVLHPDAGVLCWAATLIFSVFLWRRQRPFAGVGIIGVFLYGMLALNPHV